MTRLNLTNQEVEMLIDVCMEYLEVFGEAEDTEQYTEYMLETGLGSAMYKLTKGRRLEGAFSKYPRHRENYKYPTYEEYCEEVMGNDD